MGRAKEKQAFVSSAAVVRPMNRWSVVEQWGSA
jgi:hypothetical protein